MLLDLLQGLTGGIVLQEEGGSFVFDCLARDNPRVEKILRVDELLPSVGSILPIS